MNDELSVLVVDRYVDRLHRRADQLRLDGFAPDLAPTLTRAVERLPGADIAVVGELPGGPAVALRFIRDARSGEIPDVSPGVRILAFGDGENLLLSTFAAGADATLPSTASEMLVSSSVRALARGPAPDPIATVRLGALEFDPHTRSASIAGEDLPLSAREFGVLECLAKVPGRVFSREELSEEVWGGPSFGSRAVDAQVSRLNRRLSEAGACLVVQGVRGRGYKVKSSEVER